MPNICEVILKLSISRHKSNDRFFSKNSHSELDLKPSTLEVKLALNIIIFNICVKLHQNPSINVHVGVTAMTKFFF